MPIHVASRSNRTVIIASGLTHTPKQLHLDKRQALWSDREGMRVMRANLDGSQIETLIENGRGDEDARDQTRELSCSRPQSKYRD
jgi:hypothetical protein